MEPWHVAGALASALLHASWNAAVKAHARPSDMMTAQMVTSALLVTPGLLWTGLPAQAAWPWILASTACSVTAISALLRAYASCGFGLAYPLTRALGVVFVVPLATLVSGEVLSGFGLAGIALIVASLLLLGVTDGRGGALPARAFGWIAFGALATAAYVLCDAQGVRHAGSPFAYGFVVSLTNAIALTWLRDPRLNRTREIARLIPAALPLAFASVTSFMLILWVWSHGPIAPAAALRDTSAIFAVLIAIVWLREPFTPARLLAMLLAAAAVPLLRFA